MANSCPPATSRSCSPRRLAKEKQLHRRQLLELKAPQDGVIKDLATHTAGTVVQPGTVMASLVPSDESLKAEVWISNEDIGFVREGQTVKLKFAPYSFQKYGMGQGTVEHVSADAQSEDEARDKGLYGAGQRPLRYKALVAVDASALEVEGVKYGLSVGMRTTAEILLGNRTVAEYLLSPVKRLGTRLAGSDDNVLSSAVLTVWSPGAQSGV